MKNKRQFLAISILLIFTNVLLGQTPKTQTKPLVKQETKPTLAGGSILHGVVHYEKKLSSCDSLTLGLGFSTNTANLICYSAYPPVYSDDCLVTNEYCDFEKHVAIMTPIRDQVPFDHTNVRAITKGEKLAISVMLVARDSMSLITILKNIEVQALINNEQWVKKSMLNYADCEVSNLRSYSYSCPPQGYDKHMSDFEKYDSFSHLVVSGSRPLRGSTPRQDLSENLNIDNMMGEPELDGVMPSPGGAGNSSRVPVLNLKDANIIKEIAEHSLLKAKASLEAYIGKGTKCKKKILNYWWTDIYFEYTPDLEETQLRLHINSTLNGPDNILLGEKFNVYLAVACRHELPESDGSRNYRFIIKSSGSLNLTNVKASAVYNENVLPTNPSPEHRSIASISNSVSYPAFNINVSTASGLFPFRKNYFDDETKKDISELKCSSGDIGAIEIKGNKKVAYRLEIKTSTGGNINGLPFTSLTGDFIQPQRLTFGLMGDSYAAGEGAPYLAQGSSPWLDDDCHQSKNSGQFRAVNKFIKDHLTLACDFCVVSCSGAELEDVLDHNQISGENRDGEIQSAKSQINLVKDWMNDNSYDHISCIVIGIGGNNSGIMGSISDGIIYDLDNPWIPWGDASKHPELRTAADNGLAGLNSSNGYERLNNKLRTQLKAEHVIMQNYPDAFHASNGSLCSTDCPIPDPIGLSHSVKSAELSFGFDIIKRLNEIINIKGQQYQWNVANIFSETSNKGLCECSEILYTTLYDVYRGGQTSEFTNACALGKGRARYTCSFHPNRRGYGLFADAILSELNKIYGQ